MKNYTTLKLLNIFSAFLLTFSQAYAAAEFEEGDRIPTDESPALYQTYSASASSAGAKGSTYNFPFERSLIVDFLPLKDKRALACVSKEAEKLVQQSDTCATYYFFQQGKNSCILGASFPDLAKSLGIPSNFPDLAKSLGIPSKAYVFFYNDAETLHLQRMASQQTYNDVDLSPIFEKLVVVSRSNVILWSRLNQIAEEHSRKDCKLKNQHKVRKFSLYDILLHIPQEAVTTSSFIPGMVHHFCTDDWQIFGTEKHIATLRRTLVAAKVEELHHLIREKYLSLTDLKQHSAGSKKSAEYEAGNPLYLVVDQDELYQDPIAIRDYFTTPGNQDVELLINITQDDPTFSLNTSEMPDNVLAALRTPLWLHFINPKNNITALGDLFLSGCRVKYAVSLDLPNVRRVGNGIFSGCELKSIILKLPNLECVGNDFFAECPVLPYVNFKLPKAKDIGSGFLRDCSELEFLSLAFPEAKDIRNDFLRGSSIKKLELNLPNVENIGNDFLRSTSIEELELGLPNAKNIGDHFLAGCNDLPYVKLAMPKAKHIGNGCLCASINIKDIELDLPEVRYIGSGFLDACSSFLSPKRVKVNPALHPALSNLFKKKRYWEPFYES